VIGHVLTVCMEAFTLTRLDAPGRDVTILDAAPVAETPLATVAAVLLADAQLPSRTAEADRLAAYLGERLADEPAVTITVDTVRRLIRERAVA
jgi:hypothetical protein